jgi:hypothetical protein
MKEMTIEEYTQAIMTKNGRNDIVHKLKELVESDGWKILCMYLKQEEKGLQLQMDNINKEISFEELQKIRIRLYYIKELVGMPETFIKDISEIEDKEVPSEIY